MCTPLYGVRVGMFLCFIPAIAIHRLLLINTMHTSAISWSLCWNEKNAQPSNSMGLLVPPPHVAPTLSSFVLT